MIKKLLNVSCKQATFLAVKKEAGNINLIENIKLKIHYSICNGCKRFAAQSNLIGKSALDTHHYADVNLSEEKKKQIKDKMAQI